MTLADKKYIWSIARFVRKRLGLTTPLSIEALTEAVQKSGGKCIAVQNLDASSKGDFDAYISTDVKEDDAYFKIVYAQWKAVPRILFSIAHELGHFFLHVLDDDGKVRTDTVIYRNLQASSQEWEANEFAAELLMPGDEFIAFCQEELDANPDQTSRNIDINRVAQHFAVSAQAATVRGQILGLW